jgi:hypothetical protein
VIEIHGSNMQFEGNTSFCGHQFNNPSVGTVDGRDKELDGGNK